MAMAKQNGNSLRFGIVIFAITALLTACSSNSSTSSAPSTANLNPTSPLAISPPTVTLTEGGIYSFTASGGSGSYTYSTDTSEGGSIGSNGYYLAPSNWTGTTTVIVTDSSTGTTAIATVYIAPTSSVSPITSTASITGTLTNCVGEVGGYLNVNNWEVNGSELRSINDALDGTESPINCTGLSVAGSIPANATIVGVKIGLYVVNQSPYYDDSYVESINLINGGSTIATESFSNQLIPGGTPSFPSIVEGGSGNNWGGVLTPAILNSSSFGFTLQMFRNGNRLFLGEASSIAPQVTIYYAE